MSTNDKLREALMRIQYESLTLPAAQAIAREALAASKSEPQAQAGEPQDYAFGCNKEAKYGSQCCEKWCGRMECPTNDPIKAHADEYFRRHQFPSEGYDYNGKHAETAYTLRSGFLAGYEKCRQSHREAMEAQRKAIEFEAWEYRERYVPMLKEEIAKRDAALKACVDWMIGNATHQAGCGLYGFLGKCSCGLDSAITQAKGAQG